MEAWLLCLSALYTKEVKDLKMLILYACGALFIFSLPVYLIITMDGSDIEKY